MDNKKIILVFIGVLIIIGLISIISLYFIFPKNPSPVNNFPLNSVSTNDKQNKCGNNICDVKEKANPKLCPQDCAVELQTCLEQNGSICLISQNCSGFWIEASDTTKCCSNICNKKEILTSNDSPFGLQAPFCLKPRCSPSSTYSESNVLNHLSDIGVKWVRIIPDGVDTGKLYEKSIGIESGIARAEYPLDMDVYLEEIKLIVSQNKDYVKAWHIVNEADAGWTDTNEKFVDYFSQISQVIKSECSDCVVILNLAGGQPDMEGNFNRGLERSITFFDDISKNGIDKYYDILDIHFQGYENGYIFLKIKLDRFKEIMNKYNYDKPVWITEYATYDGDPTPDRPTQSDYPYQSETQQASGLVKKYIYGTSLGIEKMFWTTLYEWYNYNDNLNSYFSNVGLIHNSNTDGKGWKKLAYYTYKKMTEKLEGSDWNNIETIQESNNIYVYKFTNKKIGKSIWVAWSDSGSGSMSLNSLGITNAKVTEVVPDYDDGKQIVDNDVAYSSMFKEYIVVDSIQLGKAPIFIEKQ